MTDTQTLIQTRFGSFPADPGSVVTLPDGVPGFAPCRRYVVVAVPSFDPFACFQGLDEPRPSFLVIDPRLIDAGYDTALSAADRARLECTQDDPLLWLALVRLNDSGALVNLRAPVVINPARMIGLQLIAADSPYSTEHPLHLD